MFCVKCGTELQGEADYCAGCGRPLQTPEPAGTSPSRRRLVVLTSVLAGAVLTAFALQTQEVWATGPKVSRALNAPSRPAYTNEIDAAFKGDMSVAPGAYRSIRIYVPVAAIDPRITGRFRARGGLGNDIRALVLERDDLENWANGHRYSHFYDSGKITVADVHVKVNARTEYFFVFENRFSMFSSKVVDADLYLSYRRFKAR